MTNIKSELLAFVLLISSLTLTSCAALTGGGISAAVTTMSADEIISDAKKAIDTSIANAQIAGDQMINHAAYELDFTIQQIDHKLGIHRKSLVKDLDKSLQKALSQVDSFTKALNDGAYTLRTIEDDLSLDLQKTLGNIPFVDSPYTLRLIKGIQQVKLNKTSYYLTLVGSGFGEVTDTTKTEIVKFSINGTDINNSVSIYQRHRNSIVLEIKNESLSPYFQDILAVATIELTAAEMKRASQKNNKWKVNSNIPYQFRMYLHPRSASEIEVFGEGEYFEFVNNGNFCHDFTSPNNHCSDDCDESNSFPLGRGYRYVGEAIVPNYKARPPYEIGNNRLTSKGLKREFISGPNGWQSGHAQQIVENGKKMRFAFNVWTRPVTWKVCTEKETYQSVGYKPYNLKISVPYGDTFKIRLPKDPKLNEFKLTLPSQKRINGVLSENKSYLNNRFKIIKMEVIGEETVVIAQLLPPAHVQLD